MGTVVLGIIMVTYLLCGVLVVLLQSADCARLYRRQTNFGGEVSTQGGSAQPSTNTKLFFGSNGLLGNLFGGNDCACVTEGRKRRQAEVGTKFFFGGGNSCNCPEPTSSGTSTDCKGRPEGDTYYGCGCNNSGGLFGFGRRKRQTQKQGENVNTKFLDFRCIGATLLGRKANSTPNNTPNNTPNKTPNSTPNNTPNNTKNKTPNNTSVNISNNTPNNNPKYNPNNTPNK